MVIMLNAATASITVAAATQRKAATMSVAEIMAMRAAMICANYCDGHHRHVPQSVTISPGTRENSLTLSVTSAAPRRRAWAAMRQS